MAARRDNYLAGDFRLIDKCRGVFDKRMKLIIDGLYGVVVGVHPFSTKVSL